MSSSSGKPARICEVRNATKNPCQSVGLRDKKFCHYYNPAFSRYKVTAHLRHGSNIERFRKEH
jgi:hypothetical protein